MSSPADRRDDWQHGVDENLASLNTGLRVTERLIEDLEVQQASFDRMVRGDPEKKMDGFSARLATVEHIVAELHAIVIMDATGKKGLQSEVEKLNSRERTSGEKWRFATAVTVAIISLGGLIVSNWDRIETFAHRNDQPVHQTPRPRIRRHHIVVRVQPEDSNVDPD